MGRKPVKGRARLNTANDSPVNTLVGSCVRHTFTPTPASAAASAASAAAASAASAAAASAAAASAAAAATSATDSANSSQTLIASSTCVPDFIDAAFYAPYNEVHYRNCLVPAISKGIIFPPLPPTERRPVLTCIDADGYHPENYHYDALRISRIILNNLRYRTAPNWLAHKVGKRRNMFNQFQKYFNVSDNYFAAWSSKMAVSYKNLMRNMRKLIENHPEEAETIDQSIRLYWCGEKWIDKSQMAKLNRSKNPCGPRMSFIGRRGWQSMFRKFRMLHGRDPTPQEGLRLQFIREKKNTVKEADGTIREVISTEHANPYTEQKIMEVDQRIINLTQPDPSQLDTPITLSVIEQQKVIAEVFGVSKRGKVLGLGTAAANVVPRVIHERATHCNEGSASSIEETTHLKGVVQDLTAKLNQMQVMMDILMAQQLQASTSTNNSISQPSPH